jgi:ATP-dependent Lon protease
MQDDTAAVFDPAGEIQRLKDQIHSVPMPAGLTEKADRMMLRLTRMVQLGSFSQEFESMEQYVRVITSIPWGKYNEDNLDLKNAEAELNSKHYGLLHVKDMVMEYLSVMKLQSGFIPTLGAVAPVSAQLPAPAAMSGAHPVPQMAPVVAQAPAVPVTPAQTALASEMSRLQGSSSHAPVLCFVGIQGVGKTSIAKSIANALGRKFARIALGAMGQVSQIRGITRSQPNSEPGQIIKALIATGTMNPVILLDEIDKTSSESGLRADLMAALLEILDPEQNSTFVDHYLDYPIDLSRCMFITTANNLGGISAALLDRLETIRFGSYNDDEKVYIAKQHMLPKVREATGLTEAQLSFADDVWIQVVRPLGFDAGVRQLERTLTILARKVARLIVEGKTAGVKITNENFRDFIPADIGVYS